MDTMEGSTELLRDFETEACANDCWHGPVCIKLLSYSPRKLKWKTSGMTKTIKNAALSSASVFLLSSILSIVRGVDFFTFFWATALGSGLAFCIVIVWEFFGRIFSEPR